MRLYWVAASHCGVILDGVLVVVVVADSGSC